MQSIKEIVETKFPKTMEEFEKAQGIYLWVETKNWPCWGLL